MTIFVDSYWFIVRTSKTCELNSSKKLFSIKLAAFNKLSEIVFQTDEALLPAKNLVESLREAFNPVSCAIGIFSAGEMSQQTLNSARQNKRDGKIHDLQDLETTFSDVESNLRGLKTFNTLKQIISGCAIKLDKKGEENLIDLDVLKTMLRELQVQINNIGQAKGIDVCSTEGYNNWSENQDDEDIQRILKKAVLINPKLLLCYHGDKTDEK